MVDLGHQEDKGQTELIGIVSLFHQDLSRQYCLQQ